MYYTNIHLVYKLHKGAQLSNNMSNGNVSQESGLPSKIGLGSFAFRYAIGFGSFRPEKPMKAVDFLIESRRLGFKRVQLCENLNYSSLSTAELLLVKKKADELGLTVELGMSGLTQKNLFRHLYIAGLLQSKFLRIVVGSNNLLPQYNSNSLSLKDQAAMVLKAALPEFKKQGVVIGIENHFDLRSKELAELVEDIGDRQVGLVFDTTNSLAFFELPRETFEKFKPYILSVHLKDYTVKKVEAGYFITGTALGEGQLETIKLLDEITTHNPDASIIMELTTRRNEQQSMEEILKWEREQLAKSANYLKEWTRCGKKQ